MALKTTCEHTPEQDQLFSTFDEIDVLTSPTLVSGKVHIGSDPSDRVSTCSDHLQVSRSLFAPSKSVLKSPYVNPFTTPGPASTISCPPVPPQLTLDAIDISLLYSPQLSFCEDHSPGHSSPAAEPGVSQGDNSYMAIATPASRDPLLETLPQILLPVDADVNFESVVLSEHYASPAHRPPSLLAPFESHIEGCISSDPLSELSSLDVAELDFQWIAFDRSEIHHDYGPKKCLYALKNDEPEQQYPKDKSPSPDDTGRFRFQEALDTTEAQLSGSR